MYTLGSFVIIGDVTVVSINEKSILVINNETSDTYSAFVQLFYCN